MITTTTNVADEREYYTLPPGSRRGPATVAAGASARCGSSTARCRTGCRSSSYGPWSDDVRLDATRRSRPGRSRSSSRSRTSSARRRAPAAHSLTPGFVFAGDTATNGAAGQPLPRLRRHRQAVREHRVHGLRRRQPGVRAPDERADRAPDHGRRRRRPRRPPYLARRRARRGRSRPTSERRDARPSRHSGAERARRRLERRAPPAAISSVLRSSRDRRPRRPLGQRLADRPLLLDGRPGPRGHDDDGVDVPRRRGAAGRLRGRPRRRVRQDEPAGDHIATRGRTSPASRRPASSSPPRPPAVVLPRGAGRLGTRRPARPATRCSGARRSTRGSRLDDAAATPQRRPSCSRGSLRAPGTTASAGSTRTSPARSSR